MKVFFYYATEYDQIKLHQSRRLKIKYLGTSTTGLSPAQDLYRITSHVYTKQEIVDNMINWSSYPGTIMTRSEAETWISTYDAEYQTESGPETVDLSEFDDEEDDLIDFDNVEDIHIMQAKAVLEQINILRTEHSLSTYTWTQWIQNIKTK